MSSALQLMPIDKQFDLHANGRTLCLATAGTMITLSTTFVTLRFAGRYLVKAKWAWDDTLILIAFVIITSTNSLSIWAVLRGGAAMHALLIGADQLRVFLKTMYAFEIMFLAGLAWTRFAVIALYYRLFKISTWIRRTLLTFIVLNGVWWIITTMFVVFTCTPVWSLWIWEKQQSCLDVGIFFTVICATNIVLDLCVIVMPAVVLRKLNMALRKKLALCGLFGFSLILPVISAFRLNEMLFAVKINVLHTDPSYAMIGTAVWCMIELSVGISVACVPSIRPVFRWLAGKPVITPIYKPSQVVLNEKPSCRSPVLNDLAKPALSVSIEEHWGYDHDTELDDQKQSLESQDLHRRGIVISHEVEIRSDQRSLA